MLKNGSIETLEFESYNIEFKDKEFKKYNNLDKNTSNFFEDFLSQDYLNLAFKFFDSFILIIIFIFFYLYNLKKYKFNIQSIIFFISFSTSILIINQIVKNLNSSFIFYLFFTITYLIIFISILYYNIVKRNE